VMFGLFLMTVMTRMVLASWLGSLGRLGWLIVRTPDTRNRSRPYP
jgi:hypothetical protein